MTKRDFDAVVVGSGPNGLSAAIRLQQAGVGTLLIEGKNEIGGGLRTEALTLPGYLHDVCSAIHPMAVLSSFFQTLPLDQYGLEFIYPDIPLAHPFDDGGAAVLYPSADQTAILDDIVKDKTDAHKKGYDFFKNFRDRVTGGYY